LGKIAGRFLVGVYPQKGEPAASPAEMTRRAADVLAAHGTAYRSDGEDFLITPKRTGSGLNRLAVGLASKGVRLVYSPGLLSQPTGPRASFFRGGRYLCGDYDKLHRRTVFMDHMAIAENRATFPTLHELNHAHLNRELDRGRASFWEGSAQSNRPEGITPSIPSFYKRYLSFQEIATLSLTGAVLANRLLTNQERPPSVVIDVDGETVLWREWDERSVRISAEARPGRPR
jgi:hypothetical protein